MGMLQKIGAWTLFDWAGREEQDDPSGEKRGGPLRTPGAQDPGLNPHASHLLWRRSQAVELPLIQALPVLKVIVQMLH